MTFLVVTVLREYWRVSLMKNLGTMDRQAFTLIVPAFRKYVWKQASPGGIVMKLNPVMDIVHRGHGI